METGDRRNIGRHANIREQVRAHCCAVGNDKNRFPPVLAQVRWLVNHVLLQFAYCVSKTAQKLEEEWRAADVRGLNRMVSKV